MKIGIIGAGNIGGTLTRRLTALGHQVWVASSRGRAPRAPRPPGSTEHTVADLARETGATEATVEEAARRGDVVIVTIPLKNIPGLPAGLFSRTPASAVVVDTGNYYPQQRDGRIDELEEGMLESRWVERQLARPVVKAFNNIQAQHLAERGRPKGSPERIALPVAGDTAAAKATIIRLVDQLGFDPIDAGGLDESWRQQPGTPVYTSDLDADGVRRALVEAKRERSPQWRATEHSPGTFTAPA
jgi:8-hydroxy-5-deazaflavin:NADPH oxidoreductase